MVALLLIIGLIVAVFVGFNIGGSNTGAAFGPAVGANTVSKLGAGVLMTVFVLLGGWIVGPNVIDTLREGIVPESLYTLEVSIAVLFFIGFALLLSNVGGVPASTSMTTVGSIVGLGLATGSLDEAVMLEIIAWWVVSPLIAFWVSGVIGRYFYPYLVDHFAVARTEGSLLRLDRSRTLPRPALGPNTTRREFFGTVSVVVIACYVAFSAGASNVGNAVAPLIASGSLDLGVGVLIGGGAIGLGALTIARRTLDTMGNDLTQMPLLAAMVVGLVSATLVTFLSWIDIPASFVVIATMAIVGLGWGRATRTATLSDAAAGEAPNVSVGALAADAEDAPTVGGRGGTPAPREREPIGQENSEDIPSTADLFEPGTTARVIALQNLVPAVATVAAYVVFQFVLTV
ncbi:inorganic phosphate transporter [Halobacteriales archaeon QH_8_64_26]|jgi:PiT family inorganic phosphate transporter|nr:MAG: inorganic phosphate transporter [Halobacteriales archaeon QH_8_64_26]